MICTMVIKQFRHKRNILKSIASIDLRWRNSISRSIVGTRLHLFASDNQLLNVRDFHLQWQDTAGNALFG